MVSDLINHPLLPLFPSPFDFLASPPAFPGITFQITMYTQILFWISSGERQIGLPFWPPWPGSLGPEEEKKKIWPWLSVVLKQICWLRQSQTLSLSEATFLSYKGRDWLRGCQNPAWSFCSEVSTSRHLHFPPVFMICRNLFNFL